MGSIQGTVAAGGRTDDTTPTFTISLAGTAALVGDTVRLFSGTTAIAEYVLTAADINSSSVSITPTTALINGSSSFTARIIDVAGNQSSASTARTLTIDTIAPNAINLALASNTGSSTTDRITRSGVVNVTGLESGATWQYSTDNGENWSNGTGTNFTLTGDGDKSVLVRQRDIAGNLSANRSFNFVLDTATTAPTVALSTDSGSSNTDRITNSGVVNVTGLEQGATWQYSINNGTSWITGSGTSFTLTGDGAKNVLVRQRDVAGNLSGNTSFNFTLDTTTTAPLANGYSATSIAGTAEANATIFLATAPDATPVTSVTAIGTTYNNLAVPGVAEAITSYNFYARDGAGNVSAASTQKVVVGTDSADILTGVGGTGSDLLVGGAGTDTASYAVAAGVINLTGRITSDTAGSTINIRTANIDVLTGMEQIQFTNTGYTGTGTTTNQLRSTVQTTLTNNSIAAFVGSYNALMGAFTFGAGAGANATLITYDSNISTGTNYEGFLVLDRTTTTGMTIGWNVGSVTLSGL